MSSLRQDAIMMVQTLPENQLMFIVNIMRELSRLMPSKDMAENKTLDSREQAFATLESLHRKIPDLDYERELAEYREEKYL